jgi:hypothetical protein
MLEAQRLLSKEQKEFDITMFFNDFATAYLPQFARNGTTGRPPAEEVNLTLMKFWKWLKREGLSEMEVVFRPTSPGSASWL